MKKTYCKDTGFVQQIGVNELHKERIKTNDCKNYAISRRLSINFNKLL